MSEVGMIEVGEAIVSLDVLREMFACDIEACCGCCCIEGDAGAPVAEDEKQTMQDLLPTIWDDLSPEAQKVIREKGLTYKDPEGEDVTQIVDGRDCVFAYKAPDGKCFCAFEKAYRQKKTSFAKPISCHLYPIRLTKAAGYTLVNYHRWAICHCARKKGRKEGVAVYQFLKEPLVRRFGAEWYAQLEQAAQELKKQNYI